MTAAEYLERIRTAATADEAYAVSREAWADAKAKRLSVEEWNAIWTAADMRCRPDRYRESNWTGD